MTDNNDDIFSSLRKLTLFQIYELYSAMLEYDTTKEEKLELGKPLDFNEKESHSFSEWLALSKVKKIVRDTTESKDIIDNF